MDYHTSEEEKDYIIKKEFNVELKNFYENKSKTVKLVYNTTGSRFLDNYFGINNSLLSYCITIIGDLHLRLNYNSFHIETSEQILYLLTKDKADIKEVKAIVKRIVKNEILLHKKVEVIKDLLLIDYFYPKISIKMSTNGVYAALHDVYDINIIREGFMNENTLNNEFDNIINRMKASVLKLDNTGISLLDLHNINKKSIKNIPKFENISIVSDTFDITYKDLSNNHAALKFMLRTLVEYALTGNLPSMFRHPTLVKNANCPYSNK